MSLEFLNLNIIIAHLFRKIFTDTVALAMLNLAHACHCYSYVTLHVNTFKLYQYVQFKIHMLWHPVVNYYYVPTLFSSIVIFTDKPEEGSSPRT